MFRSFILRGCRWLIRHLDPSYDRTDTSKAEKSRSVWDHESQFLHYLDDLPELKMPAPQSDPVKIIWQFWWQGEESAPLIVKRCMESVQRVCSDFRIIRLDKNNIGEYITVPDCICKRFQGLESTAHYSDYVRFAILEKYGGVWLDATEYLTAPVPTEILNSVYFVNTSCYWIAAPGGVPEECAVQSLDSVAYPSNNYLVGNTGIVAAKKGSRTVKAIKCLLERYWEVMPVADTYLFIQYFQTLVIWYNAFCEEEYRSMPKRDYCTPNILRAQIGAAFDSAFMESVKKLTFMHKLSYKNLGGLVDVLPDGRETYLGRISKGDQL